MWGEIDAAGSVDLSTVVRYSMEALEHWFRERLGLDWHQLHFERRLSAPFVRSELDFRSPVLASDVLAVAVEVRRLGTSSVLFQLVGRAEGRDATCWEGRFTCVFSDAATGRSAPVPEPYREIIATQLTRTD
jgi:acyl-CoA thioesterase FadM